MTARKAKSLSGCFGANDSVPRPLKTLWLRARLRDEQIVMLGHRRAARRRESSRSIEGRAIGILVLRRHRSHPAAGQRVEDVVFLAEDKRPFRHAENVV